MPVATLTPKEIAHNKLTNAIWNYSTGEKTDEDWALVRVAIETYGDACTAEGIDSVTY